ncbi:hypothetical protein INT47_012905 [Mucor saturninus]|uniref:NAD(+) kinase n=1 Tax=Mucor saturninus TaxID=64648 RepID=A0A8H7URZ4_9FUNG|nr:hypothetical protein INT47_012905 [Mucor saturninus]
MRPDSNSGGTKREPSPAEARRPKKKPVASHQQHSTWDPDKNSILILTKARDNKLVTFTQHLVEWLIFTPRFGKKNPFVVYVDAHLKESSLFDLPSLVQKDPVWQTQLRFWTPKLCYKKPELFHLIITLGGDGTILFTSTLFQSHVPPIIPFHLGSLGFLAPFLFTSYREELTDLFEGRLQNIACRMRLSCTVYKYNHDSRYTSNKEAHPKSWELMETAWMRKTFHQTLKMKDVLHDEKMTNYSTTPMQTFHVLNEVIVDRGPSSNMSMLELFGNERHLTTVQADGLCIATATGSTAYSLSAGGTLTHPDMQCTLVTPVCPHTLSFRPMHLPSSIKIRIFVPFGSRHSAYCRFDGRNGVELQQGDHITIMMSPYHVRTYASSDTSNDWFSSVQSSLLWNNRQRQKSFGLSDENDLALESDKMNACVEPADSSKNYYQLNPWTEDELKRDPIGHEKASKM